MRTTPISASLALLLAAACGGTTAPPPVTGANPPPAVAASPPAAPAVAPAAHAPKAPVPLEEYYKIRRVGSRSGILITFSHDEKLVAYLSDEGGRTDVWVQPVAGGPATQITHVQGFVQGGPHPSVQPLTYPKLFRTLSHQHFA